MANLTTSADILTYSKDRAGIEDDNTQLAELAIESLNRAHHSMLLGGLEFDPIEPFVFPWAVAQNPIIVNLEPAIDAGTVAVTNRSTTITFSSAPTVSVVDQLLQVLGAGDKTLFRIVTHTAGMTAATLDAEYTGDTNAAADFKVFKLRYQIGTNNIHAIIDPVRVYRDTQVGGQNAPGEMELRYGTILSPDELKNVQEDVPNRAYVDFISDGNVCVTFNAYPAKLTRTEFFFISVPTDLANDTGIPLVPRMYRQVLTDMTTYFIQEKKVSSDAERTFALAQRGLNGMIREFKQKISRGNRNWGRMFPRKDDFGDFRRLLRTETGLIIR